MDPELRYFATRYECGDHTPEEFRHNIKVKLDMLSPKQLVALAEAIADYDDGRDE